MSTTQKIGRAMMWSVGGRIGRFVLSMASSVIVVRSLGDHDYGVLSVVRTILMFVVLFVGGGMCQSLLKFLPGLRVQRAGGEALRLVRRVTLVHIAVWLLVAAVTYVGRPLLERAFDFDGFGVLIVAAILLVVFELFFKMLSQLLNASYDTGLLSLAGLLNHIVYIVGLVILLPRGWGIMGVILAGAAGQLVGSVVVLGRIRAAIDVGDAEPTEPIATGRLARYAIPFTAIGMLNVVVWRQSETLLLAHFRSAAETGYFDLAYRLSQLVLEFVPTTVWPLVMAGVSEAYARDRSSLGAAIDRYYRMLFILAAPICVMGVVLGGKVVTVLYTETMAPAAVPTQLFFLVFTMSFFASPLSMALYVMEKTHVNLLIYIVLAAVNIGLDLILIPRYGVVGAMIPVAFVIGVSPFIYRAVIAREIATISIPLRFIARCFLASSVGLLVFPLVRFVDGPIGLAATGIASGVLIVAGYKIFRVITSQEVDWLGSVPLPFAGRLLKFIST